MDCFCGCGLTLERAQGDLNLEAGKLALELLAWDKERFLASDGEPESGGEVDELVREGATLFQAVLDELHGASGSYRRDAVEAWLSRSRQARRDRPGMTRKRLSWRTSNEPDLEPRDLDRLDRRHPELSYTGRKQ